MRTDIIQFLISFFINIIGFQEKFQPITCFVGFFKSDLQFGDSVATYNNSEKEIMEEPEKRDVAEVEAMIQKLLNSTPQQLGLEEEEARKRMKQKQK